MERFCNCLMCNKDIKKCMFGFKCSCSDCFLNLRKYKFNFHYECYCSEECRKNGYDHFKEMGNRIYRNIILEYALEERVCKNCNSMIFMNKIWHRVRDFFCHTCMVDNSYLCMECAKTKNDAFYFWHGYLENMFCDYIFKERVNTKKDKEIIKSFSSSKLNRRYPLD